MKTSARILKEFSFQITLYLFIKCALVNLSILFLILGTGALAARSLSYALDLFPALIAAGMVFGLGMALIQARRRAPPEEEVLAILDLHNRCGGLLAAIPETDIASWEPEFRRLSHPEIRWKDRHLLGVFSASSVFVLVILFVPPSLVVADSPQKLHLEKERELLSLKVEALKEEEVLDLAKAEKLQEKIEQTLADSSGEDPAKTFEALDHLDDIATKAAQKSAEETVGQSQKLDRAQELVDKLLSERKPLDLKERNDAMKELAKTVKEATKSFKQSPGLKAFEKALEKGNLTPEQLKKLSKALQEHIKKLEGSLGKMIKAKLIDKKMLGKCRKAKKGEKPDFYVLSDGKEKPDALLMIPMSGKDGDGDPGSGGINRGRGDAEMKYGPKTREGGTEFKDTPLPPGEVVDPSDSITIGESVGAPTVDNEAGPSAAGALSGASADEGSANTRVILPRHQGAVRRYFERKK